MECDYFYLRALVKNLDRVESRLYRKHLSRKSRRAMGIAFVDGSAEHYALIRELAWRHLPSKYRFFYRCAVDVAEPGARNDQSEAANDVAQVS